MSKWLSLLIFAISIFISAAPPRPVSALDDEPHVIISAIKTDGSGSSEEYVHIYNAGSAAVSTKNLVIEYSESPSIADYELCATNDWTAVTKRREVLDGQLIESGESLSIYVGTMLDNKPGSVRLAQYIGSQGDETMIVHDVVGWGEESNKPYCAETSPAFIPKDDQHISRCADEAGKLVDTDDNSKDFLVVSETNTEPPLCPEYPVEEPGDPDESGDTLDCERVFISEILPNPEGDDSGNEFIEIHNPTDQAISLRGCAIGLDKVNSTLFAFPENDILPAKEYRAYYDGQTGLRLTNSTPDKILLVSGQSETAYTYPADMKDDIAWADIGGEWQQTNRATPGIANMSNVATAGRGVGDVEVPAPCPAGKYRNPATNRCKNIEIPKVLAPCGEGKERNPETNRCRSIMSVLASLAPCKPGQERNPATNRCRSVLSASSKLTPCKPGQKRNPDTNRCRKIASTSTELKPCPEGQERSAETNRCRKVQATLASATGLDDKKSDKKNLINYGLLGLVGVTAIGYGAYEYRHDFRYKMSALRTRFFPKDGGK